MTPEEPQTQTRSRQKPLRLELVNHATPDELDLNVTWQNQLVVTEKGQLKKTCGNLVVLLKYSPEWKGCLGLNEMDGHVYWTRPPPANTGAQPARGERFSDYHYAVVEHWFALERGAVFSKSTIFDAVAGAAEHNRFHKVREYLQGLRWDGKQRLPTLLSHYFGAEQNEYSRDVGVKWLIAAVARVMRPGCKVDNMVVLEGPQGARKSSAICELFGEQWFSDTEFTIGDKDSYQQLRGKWCIEMGELSNIKGREVEKVKKFLSARVDSYRPSYARSVQDFPRQCVFVGSTNDKQYLTDPTGARRYWPVAVKAIDMGAISEDRDKLWAEAYARYDSGERWWLDTEEANQRALIEQAKREEDDDWLPIVAKWLDNPVVPGDGTLYPESEGLTTGEALRYALSVPPERIDNRATQRAGRILRRLGYERRQLRAEGKREWRYYPVEEQS